MNTIAIDLDDTLNNFTETLQNTQFSHDASYAISEEVFHGYIQKLRSDAVEESDLLSTEFSFFRYKIHHQCYALASARADGVAFMQWLRAHQWRIVICTHRDLRRANDCTRKWLQDHNIPFDYLFMAWNKLDFCRVWGIEYLVDDFVLNVVHGERYGIQVFYPMMPKHQALEPNGAKGFQAFDQVRQWIQK